MSKEYLEALERMYSCNDDDYTLGYRQHDYKLLKDALSKSDSNSNEPSNEALNKAFDYGVQSVLDSLLLRGYNTKAMLKQEILGKTLEEDLDEAKRKVRKVI